AAAENSGLQVILPTFPGFPPIQHQNWIPMVDNVEPGSGITLDWHDLDYPGMGERWILAGGLSPSNVGEAIAATAAWGVDASSGLESAPGVKDLDLIEAFVRVAKETSAWEQRASETRT
ncbi:MAG: phosphoribosylanthranilate isomerase, partial [Acidimicrobiia bacterium]|nr:phosphoribosylanthranilate isomerase [Acidimicrobiia bacterium]